MAKKTRVPKELTRRQISRLEKERRLEKTLIWSVVAMAVVIVAVLTYGLVLENVIKARQPIAVVGDVAIPTSEFQAFVRYARMQMQLQLVTLEEQRQSIDPTDETSSFILSYLDNQISQLQSSLDASNALTIGDQAADRLILYELARQEVARRGIQISDDDVQRAIEVSLGYDRDASTPPVDSSEEISPTEEGVLPTATPVTEEAFQERYQLVLSDMLKPLNISEKAFRRWNQGDVAVQKLQEALLEEAPAEGEQVKLSVLSVDGEALANELAARIDAGETLAVIGEELAASDDPSGSLNELDWLPISSVEDYIGPVLATQSLLLSVGEHTPPMPTETAGVYTIVEMVGHETREYSDGARQSIADELFTAWYESAEQAHVVRKAYADRVPTTP